MRTLDPTLFQIGDRLQREGERTVQKPMPWRFLDLLCQLDEKEEVLAAEKAGKRGRLRRSRNRRRACHD
jgi:hypothetical protein